MGCGATNNTQTPVLPVSSSPRQNERSVPSKEQTKNMHNNADSSLRGSNLNAATSGKMTNSKSGIKGTV